MVSIADTLTSYRSLSGFLGASRQSLPSPLAMDSPSSGKVTAKALFWGPGDAFSFLDSGPGGPDS